jgi:DNA-binding MarR family transcriptional regulator
MDVATIKGVLERLVKRGYAEISPDPVDRRRVLVALTPSGRDAYERAVATARKVSAETLEPLAPEDREMLLRLLKRLRPGDDVRGGPAK